jgi:hypothetical protein
MAHRGKCLHIYADNGTNVIGAHHKLQELQKLFMSEQFKSDLEKFAATQKLTWHPPNSPHSDGIGEAGAYQMMKPYSLSARNYIMIMPCQNIPFCQLRPSWNC